MNGDDMNTKPIWQSKTFWVNLVGLVTVLLPVFNLPQVLDPEIAASILAVVNLVLRYLTVQPGRLV